VPENAGAIDKPAAAIALFFKNLRREVIIISVSLPPFPPGGIFEN